MTQKTVMRPNRIWRPMIEDATDVLESHFRTASLSRLTLPRKIKHLADDWQPDAMMAWVPKGCKLMPQMKGCIRVLRLGDYPRSLKKLGNVDVVVANTPGIVQRVDDLGWARERAVISNFTDTTRAMPVQRSDHDTPVDATLLVSCGRFVQRKGFDNLIRATATSPNTYLWLLGDGDDASALRSLVKELHVTERVRFLGWRKDVKPFIAAADAFVMPSRHEPLGNVILEAWAQGVPVVSTRSEGPQWFMKHRENGLVVGVEDVEGIATAIHTLRTDAELRSDLVEGGYGSLNDTFSEHAVIKAYLQLFARHRVDAEKLVAQHLDHINCSAVDLVH
ncbi:glycosyltransferase [Yoonia sp. GPGPB17]|uniref:glycosyltransferase n=1 Tax=Yoonia sp. GPGPB17 TaxID=3026147 RepID=UPI0030BA9805